MRCDFWRRNIDSLEMGADMESQTRRIARATRRSLKHALEMADLAIARRDSGNEKFAENWADFLAYGLNLLETDPHLTGSLRDSLRSHAASWERFAGLWAPPKYNDLRRALTELVSKSKELQTALDAIIS